MKSFLRCVVPAVFAVAFSGNVFAVDVEAGPIWSDSDAKAKCPKVCSSLEWNGQWTTTEQSKMSVCGTKQGVDIPIGPIWNNDDAKAKCPTQIAKVTWSGQWTTTKEGEMSVCGCTPAAPLTN